MGYEVRRVPESWEHPKGPDGEYLRLHDGATFARLAADWDEAAEKWAQGIRSDFNGGWVPLTEEQKGQPYSAWDGERPDEKNFMPLWRDEERTHFMLYENITEGTPVSPVFATAEELARWRADSEYVAKPYPSQPGADG